MLLSEVSMIGDFDQWIRLAREVEPLFGPMVEDPGFREGLRQALVDRNAFCVRREDGEAGQNIQGGIVVSPRDNEILWFAVAGSSRGQGVGKVLLDGAIRHLDPQRPMIVTTFDRSVEAGLPARRLYRRHGFKDDRPGGLNPAGIPTVVMVRSNRTG